MAQASIIRLILRPSGREPSKCSSLDHPASIAMQSTVNKQAMAETTRSRLATARSAATTIPSLKEISLRDGYEIGVEIEDERRAAGWRRVGWKLGFTNMALWPKQGVDAPFWAPVYTQTLITGELPTEGPVQPRIEPEIVVGLKADLPPGSGPSAIADAIDWAAAGLEVVECHFEGWSMSAAEAVADAGLHAGLAIGSRKRVNAAEAIALSNCECEFLRDGTLVNGGLATTALDGPVAALVWLLRGLPEGLQAGDIITTGSMIGATPVSAGQRWTSRLHGPVSSSVEITFT